LRQEANERISHLFIQLEISLCIPDFVAVSVRFTGGKALAPTQGGGMPDHFIIELLQRFGNVRSFKQGNCCRNRLNC